MASYWCNSGMGIRVVTWECERMGLRPSDMYTVLCGGVMKHQSVFSITTLQCVCVCVCVYSLYCVMCAAISAGHM